eukprot:1671377-Prymnesium_polylepis.1
MLEAYLVPPRGTVGTSFSSASGFSHFSVDCVFSVQSYYHSVRTTRPDTGRGRMGGVSTRLRYLVCLCVHEAGPLVETRFRGNDLLPHSAEWRFAA